jgi:sterol desaturase/sphingolipid hydroxylase (fatty acid hydroxylase superfamily)
MECGHRLHHVADEVDGNVNFGLFTLVWDRLLGTYRDPNPDEAAPAVGVADGALPAS